MVSPSLPSLLPSAERLGSTLRHHPGKSRSSGFQARRQTSSDSFSVLHDSELKENILFKCSTFEFQPLPRLWTFSGHNNSWELPGH
ncbi:hypothetical protein MPER_07374 [Moniliophthora perniciosa FA553]|nr:hypothetical protein MPER_07374 [Moniliophthora perniciosa FA553]